MGPFVRIAALFFLSVVWSGGAQQARANQDASCDTVHTVTVSPEEYVGDMSLTKLMSHLITIGRKMAVEQVTTTRVIGSSSETIKNDAVNFRSYSSERFVGTVTSHELLARETGRIGSRETLRLTLRVNVCVGPVDQVWYVRIGDIESEAKGELDWMKSRLKSPTDRIQLVRSGDLGADVAAFRIQGMVFSENVALRNYTNEKEIQAYDKCLRKLHSQDRNQRRMLNSFGLSQLTNIIQGTGDSSRACGYRPQRTSGKRLEAEAVFQVKICDTHLGDCQTVRQPYDSRTVVKTKQDEEVAVRRFYHEGFGLAGAFALHNLQRSLGMLDK